jgi:RNA polymerase sigma-70 factor, ECF subfamily
MTPSEEVSLVLRAKQGDREALGVLWDALTPKLFGYLVNTLRDKTLAEDILQATWLKAVRALPNFEPRGISISAWLFAIAKNECRDHWKKGGREVLLDPELHDKAEGSHEQFEHEFMIEKILAGVSELDREILRLRYIADMPVEHIGKILKMTPGTARVRIHRALVRARASFNSHYEAG